MLMKLRHKKRNKGYTLIELLIANGLGIMMIAGVVQVFTSNSQTIRVVDASARVQESGRIAMDMLAKDVRMADYWGCSQTSDILNHLVDNSTTPPTADDDYDETIHNPSNAAGLAGANDISTATTIDSINVKLLTDTITFRGSSQLNGVKVIKPYMTTVAAAIHITDGADIPQGTLLLVSDCEGGDYFSNSAGNTLTSGTLAHNTGNVSNINNQIQPMSHTYKGNAVLSMPYSTTYFVGEGTNSAYSLYRYQPELGRTDELIPNVTDLQLTYGEDTTGDNSANLYADADTADIDNAMAVRITVTLESPNDNIVGSDPLRREYTTTATIRNRLL